MSTKRKKSQSPKPAAISEAERAIVRAAVRGDVRAVAIVERVFAKLDELEQHLDDIGPPMMPKMG